MTVPTDRHLAPEQVVGQLGHGQHTDLEAVGIQMDAVSRAIENLATAVEGSAPGSRAVCPPRSRTTSSVPARN